MSFFFHVRFAISGKDEECQEALSSSKNNVNVISVTSTKRKAKVSMSSHICCHVPFLAVDTSSLIRFVFSAIRRSKKVTQETKEVQTEAPHWLILVSILQPGN